MDGNLLVKRVKFPWVGWPMPLPCKECDDVPCIDTAKDDAVIKWMTASWS